MGALPQVKYSGRIREIKMGKAGCEMVVGGETAYNFYLFEGSMPNPPKLALQVLDMEPEEWAHEALEPFKDAIGDPVAWAKKCVEEFGADLVCLWLEGTDPNGKNLPAEHAAQVAQKVAEAISVPLIVWGVSSDEKNTEVLRAVAESCAGLKLVLGPVTEKNYKQVGAAAIAYQHIVAANSPIDINLAKQLNILLENLGVPNDRILIDPTTGSVGYGMEYCYSIMERIRQAALTQNDEKLQYPIINNIAEEVWKTKEAKLREEDDTRLGNSGIRGVNLEAITALSALQAGSDLLILRHPQTLKHIRKYLSEVMITTDLDSMGMDLAPAPQAAAPSKPAVIGPSPVPKTEPAEKKTVMPPMRAVVKAASENVAEPLSPSTEEIAETRTEKHAPPTMAARELREPELELTEEDVQLLREMAEMVRVAKTLVSGLARLISGGVKGT